MSLVFNKFRIAKLLPGKLFSYYLKNSDASFEMLSRCFASRKQFLTLFRFCLKPFLTIVYSLRLAVTSELRISYAFQMLLASYLPLYSKVQIIARAHKFIYALLVQIYSIIFRYLHLFQILFQLNHCMA